jgi:probable DNA metabolism protein
MNASVYLYDGSFEGFLTVVFEAFNTKGDPVAIISVRRNVQLPLGDSFPIRSDKKKAQRVWAGLEKRTSPKNARLVQVAFLAQEPQTEMLLWRYLKKIFTIEVSGFFQNMLDEDVFGLVQMARRVKHEVHRFHGFVRFQETADGLYFAAIDPDHDIVRLLTSHFRARFAGQVWVIYDTKRNHGVYYDTQTVMDIVIDYPGFDEKTGALGTHIRSIDQDHYSQLWKAYYDSINIIERQNHRQMKRAMPQRYWKYLPEKKKG